MTTKAEADWSEEEQKLVKDYEKRVRELQEEREKFRKVKLQTVKDFTIESNPRPGTYGTPFLSSKLKQEINSATNWQDANYNLRILNVHCICFLELPTLKIIV